MDDSEPPALASTQSDREEGAALESGVRLNEGCSLNRSRRLQTDVGCLKTKRQPLRIGTLYVTWKLDNAIKEAKDMRIDILGLLEIRWTGSGKIQKEEHTIMYSGGDNHTRGVGIMVNKNINKAVLGYWPVYNTIQYNTIQYNTIQYNTIQYNTIQYNTIQYNTIQYNTIQYNTIQYNTIQYNTIQYNTTSFISNIEHNNITPTIYSQHWDGWKGGGQKNILIVVHPQHQLISIVNVK